MRVWNGILSAGDIIGKLLAVLTLPASLFAGYIYLDEIVDYFSKPHLSASIERATIRCNYVWRDSEAYYKYQSGDASQLRSLCDASDLAISFEVSFENLDSIDREIRALSVDAQVLGLVNLEFREVRAVDHLIQHGVETTIQRDWRVETLGPGGSAVFEIIAIPTSSESEVAWHNISEPMNSGGDALLGKSVEIALSVQTSGSVRQSFILSECKWSIDSDEVSDWSENDMNTRIQITNVCEI
jgi:hypothetical protein